MLFEDHAWWVVLSVMSFEIFMEEHDGLGWAGGGEAASQVPGDTRNVQGYFKSCFSHRSCHTLFGILPEKDENMVTLRI